MSTRSILPLGDVKPDVSSAEEALEFPTIAIKISSRKAHRTKSTIEHSPN